MPRVSFDPIAKWYDRTRSTDPVQTARALAFVRRKFPPARFPRVLELGVGTGRLAFPMRALGYRVLGVDVSRGMLAQYRAKLRGMGAIGVEAIRADARHLPLRSGTFRLVYWVHLLHLVPGWRRALDEALRVAPAGGVLLGIWTEGGRAIPAVSEFYRRRASALGFPPPRLGVRRSETAFRYLRQRGCRVVQVPHHWRRSDDVSVGEAIYYLEHRVFSTLRHVPPDVHRRVIRELRAWARRQWGSPATQVRVAGEFTILYARIPRRAVSEARRRPAPAATRRPRGRPSGGPNSTGQHQRPANR